MDKIQNRPRRSFQPCQYVGCHIIVANPASYLANEASCQIASTCQAKNVMPEFWAETLSKFFQRHLSHHSEIALAFCNLMMHFRNCLSKSQSCQKNNANTSSHNQTTSTCSAVPACFPHYPWLRWSSQPLVRKAESARLEGQSWTCPTCLRLHSDGAK